MFPEAHRASRRHGPGDHYRADVISAASNSCFPKRIALRAGMAPAIIIERM
jgi:hypothetical protein